MQIVKDVKKNFKICVDKLHSYFLSVSFVSKLCWKSANKTNLSHISLHFSSKYHYNVFKLTDLFHSISSFFIALNFFSFLLKESVDSAFTHLIYY